MIKFIKYDETTGEITGFYSFSQESFDSVREQGWNTIVVSAWVPEMVYTHEVVNGCIQERSVPLEPPDCETLGGDTSEIDLYNNRRAFISNEQWQAVLDRLAALENS